MKRGPKPRGHAEIKWSPEFAYAVGLLTADGCLLSDGRHIDFTSKDKELVQTFKECLKLKTKVSTKKSGLGKMYFRVQFSDVLFREFLISIGITPKKSKIIGQVKVPDGFFRDFLRGYFDGDGTSYSFYDSLFPTSYRFYISFASASPAYILWLQGRIKTLLGLKGYINRYTDKPYLQLKYAKKEAIVLVSEMYYADGLPHLSRKYLKIKRTMSIIDKRRGGGTW